MYRSTFAIWLIFMETIICAPTDGLRSILDEGEVVSGAENNLKGIVPGHLPPAHESLKPVDDKIIEEDVYLQSFYEYVKEGLTMKGLVFNIYDEAMKDLSISVLELLKHLKAKGYDYKSVINNNNVNEDLLNYVQDIFTLYHTSIEEAEFTPPFIDKPNFFVNGEAIFKALKLSHDYNFTNFNNSEEAEIESIVINTNYSGWNIPKNGGDEELNYFREDISLNSYYYGVHLMHPYWFSSQVLDSVYLKNSEYYYYRHQQLLARYLLEKEYLKQMNLDQKYDYSAFNPYLVHDNGLPFPNRYTTSIQWNGDLKKIKKIDIAIRECMSRKIVFMDNVTIPINKNNYVKLLSKLIRANYDGLKTAQLVRNILGSNNNEYKSNVYNPAPSVLHFPETTLRDPFYWNIMKYALSYFTDYKDKMEPWTISQYEMEDVNIVEGFMPKLTTYFDYYQFSIKNAISKNSSAISNSPLNIAARQKRIKHSQFAFNFAIDSRTDKDVIIRLFLGPLCDGSNCWDQYSKFFELDKFKYHFEEGINFVSWSPATSEQYSNDAYYNLEETSYPKVNKSNKYNMFKFPENLVIPRGLDKGLNLTVFVMITPADSNYPPYSRFKMTYRELHNDIDKKPLGFPFHRPAIGYNYAATSYSFYNVTIYHKIHNDVKYAKFSCNLD